MITSTTKFACCGNVVAESKSVAVPAAPSKPRARMTAARARRQVALSPRELRVCFAFFLLLRHQRSLHPNIHSGSPLPSCNKYSSCVPAFCSSLSYIFISSRIFQGQFHYNACHCVGCGNMREDMLSPWKKRESSCLAIPCDSSNLPASV